MVRLKIKRNKMIYLFRFCASFQLILTGYLYNQKYGFNTNFNSNHTINIYINSLDTFFTILSQILKFYKYFDFRQPVGSKSSTGGYINLNYMQPKYGILVVWIGFPCRARGILAISFSASIPFMVLLGFHPLSNISNHHQQ